jgi:hypothetical protein
MGIGAQTSSGDGSRGLKRFPEPARDDLSRAESVATAIHRAFPLPESGAFADLLAALEDEPQA